MKKSLIMAVTVIFISCRNPVRPAAPAVPGVVDQAVVVQIGQRIEYVEQGFSVHFSAVEEDSRCPVGVRCVWEGNARITVLVNGETMALNTKTEPAIGHFGVYSISLLALEPYPEMGKPQTVPYRATILSSMN